MQVFYRHFFRNYPPAIFIFLFTLFPGITLAAERSCDGEVYAQFGQDSVTLFRVTASAKAGTVNAARREARDAITRCAVDVWYLRWNLLGADRRIDLPSSCGNVSGFYPWDIDLKSRIVSSGCALWSSEIHRDSAIPLQIRLRTMGAEGCGSHSDLQRTRTISLNYQLTQQMCKQGY